VIARRAAPALALLAALAAMLGGACAGAAASQRRVDHVIVVTVDGMTPATYLDPDAHGLQVPTLREITRRGTSTKGARSVFPTVTYPAHTSIATGVSPRTHGIVTNTAFDPEGKNQDGWRWYSEDIRAPTLWEVAAGAGMSTALVNWPVTVGARASWVVPEYWRAGTGDDAKLTRAMSTPGLLDEVAAKHPDLWDRFTPPNVEDSVSVDIAVHLIETKRPNLLFLHIWQVDDAQHATGLWSERSKAALENADAQIGRLIDAAKQAGIWDRTAIVVVSDHGFQASERRVRPGAAFAAAGLVTLDEQGKPTDWKAYVLASGGTGYVYLRDPGDAAARERVAAILAGTEGIGRVLDATAIEAAGGDPRAAFAIEAADGWMIGNGWAMPITEVSTTTVASHGFDPARDSMRASLLFYGPSIGAAGLTGDPRLVDVAPTIAAWLGLSLPSAEGTALPVPMPFRR
jgi:predicted AlkP superfamily pyrophosphatase or phosphodiesterase